VRSIEGVSSLRRTLEKTYKNYLNFGSRFSISAVTASIILLSVTNIIVFFIADASRPDSGVFFFFADISLVSLVLFYHNNLKLGIVFMTLPLLLGIAAYYNENSLLEATILTGTNKDINFTINLILGIFTSVIVILFVIRRNNESEDSLIANKESLEQMTKELKIKNQELQKTNDELDRFVYSASHDMRAPLSTLLGLIEIAKISNKPEEIPIYFDMMTNRIHDMEGFIRKVTDYSQNTRLDLYIEKVNIRETILNIKESYDFLAKDSSVKVDLNLPKNLEIHTDPTRLKVVLNNLYVNAIKYFDPRKEDRYVSVSSEITGDYCIVEIEDNGIGIPAEYHSRIFDMFFRASANSNGSGLGLYIVQETLAKLNGFIVFDSTPNKGSKFTIELPLNLVTEQEAS
jgi:signal transduction histidine kinase